MALVVLLKGVNVGGYRTFRPSALARDLKRLDVVSLGAAGTFVVRKPISRAALDAELKRRLPFEADVMICRGSDFIRLASHNPFAHQSPAPNIVQFVSLLAKRRPPPWPVPFEIPSGSPDWCVRVLGQQDRFVFGLYRREMRAIRCLAQLEQVFGVPLTTRNWNSILAIVRVLKHADAG